MLLSCILPDKSGCIHDCRRDEGSTKLAIQNLLSHLLMAHHRFVAGLNEFWFSSDDSHLFAGDDLAESMTNSISRPANRSRMKFSNADFLLLDEAPLVGSRWTRESSTVEQSLRTLILKLSIAEGRHAALLLLRCVFIDGEALCIVLYCMMKVLLAFTNVMAFARHSICDDLRNFVNYVDMRLRTVLQNLYVKCTENETRIFASINYDQWRQEC